MFETTAWRERVLRPVLRVGAADALLPAALVALSFVPGIAHQGVDLAELPDDRPLDALGLALVAAQTAPLVLRRRFPVTCLAVVAAAFTAFQLLRYPTAFASLALIVALYTVGTRPPRRPAPVAAGAVAAYALVCHSLYLAGSRATVADYLAFGLVLAACCALGGWVRARALEAEERRRRAEADAAAAERARIARDLHDVVTHHVTSMVVQADTAGYLLGGSDRVGATLTGIGETGRRALDDLRQLLGVLDAREEPAGPSLSGLAGLVERSRRAGQSVDLVEDGEPRPMRPQAEEALYRVVQESVTNALKHAPGRHVVVRIDHGDGAVGARITTGGGAPPAEGAGPPPPRPGGGRGLTGLRERVGAVGGELRAGPSDDGGFTVHASVPRGRT
ncbi:sensor histidine kinase [Nocardiopsis sp. NPDC101807]|uniref:sensor histidine kinase n=1 Tax=Nocardiopsis sp. NPDC101807 TaxID=3364339 RepID=UPI0037FCE6AA